MTQQSQRSGAEPEYVGEHPYFEDGQWWCDDCDKPATYVMGGPYRIGRFCNAHMLVNEK